MSRLFMDLEPGDVVDVDDGRIQLTVVEKSGRRARVRFEADRSIPIVRNESQSSEVDDLG